MYCIISVCVWAWWKVFWVKSICEKLCTVIWRICKRGSKCEKLVHWTVRQNLQMHKEFRKVNFWSRRVLSVTSRWTKAKRILSANQLYSDPLFHSNRWISFCKSFNRVDLTVFCKSPNRVHTSLYVCKSSNKVDLTVLIAPNRADHQKWSNVSLNRLNFLQQ